MEIEIRNGQSEGIVKQKQLRSSDSPFAIESFIGDSEWTHGLRQRILQVAKYNYTALVTGPSGTGKELIARAVHAHGPRSDKPFIPVNCAAIPSSLFSSQLFGHVKGAFTGAQYTSLGCFRAAEEGTIFLDEIGELDLDCQAKLLRVLQDKIVTPVGGHDGVTVDVRTIAATNRDLAEEVRAGRFRLDLFYRLNVLAIETQGLVDRVADIEPLANHFLAKTAVECGLPLKRLSPSALNLLRSYDWPGNVRELENFIDRAVVSTEETEIGPESFPEIYYDTPSPVREIKRSENPQERPACEFVVPDDTDLTTSEKWKSLAEVEREHIEKTLRRTFYNQSAAARLLQIDRKLLARKIRKHEIVLPKSVDKQGS